MTYLAILLCGVAAMIIGSIWHGPWLFGKVTMRMMGAETMTAEQKEAMKKSMAGMYALQFILSLITVEVLRHSINNWTGTASAMTVALVLWFGFVVTSYGSGALWSGKSKGDSWKMFLIGAGGQLVTFIAYVLILGMFR